MKTNHLFTKILVAFQLLLFSSASFSQVYSIEFSYPLTVQDNVVNPNYIGLIDIKTSYTKSLKKYYFSETSVNVSFLKHALLKNGYLKLISPKVKFGYDYSLNDFSIIPYLGFGYTNLRCNFSKDYLFDPYGNLIPIQAYKKNANGITCNTGFRFCYRAYDKILFYTTFSYDYIYIINKTEDTDISGFAKDINVFYPGIGMSYIF